MVTWTDRVAIISGFVLLVWGVAMVYVPAAFITAGTLILSSAIWRKE